MDQDGQGQRQDEARWRQDAKNGGCLERFGPLSALRLRTSRQQPSEPGPRGGVGEGINPTPLVQGIVLGFVINDFSSTRSEAKGLGGLLNNTRINRAGLISGSRS